jgi:ribonucleoside-triphosphate reductase
MITLRDKETIDKEIEVLKQEWRDCLGSHTEVYQRIVGYARNVNNWNAGKREEYRHRKNFIVPGISFLDNKAVDCKTVESMV